MPRKNIRKEIDELTEQRLLDKKLISQIINLTSDTVDTVLTEKGRMEAIEALREPENKLYAIRLMKSIGYNDDDICDFFSTYGL